MAPRVHSRRGLRRAAEEWAETLAPWTSYTVLLVVVLLPPIGLVGVVTLALLLSLLYVHQSFVLPESRARLQRPIWALLAVLIAVCLASGSFPLCSLPRLLLKRRVLARSAQGARGQWFWGSPAMLAEGAPHVQWICRYRLVA